MGYGSGGSAAGSPSHAPQADQRCVSVFDVTRAPILAFVCIGLWAAAAVGCGDDDVGGPDAGAGDGGSADARAPSDGGATGDAGDVDAAGADAGDADASLDMVPLPASVTITSSAEGIAHGTTPMLSWTVAGDTTGLGLVLRATAPGDGSAPAGAHWLSPGTLIATGEVRYLASDLSWSDTSVTFASAPTAGSATVTLPSPDEGEWRFTADLVDATGAVVSSSSAAVLVTLEPAMRLSISRLSAGPDDMIHASLALGPGSDRTLNVIVTAWLVAPDGTMTTFPGDSPGTRALYEGPAKSDRLELFDRTFAMTGLWRVVARMFDATTHRLLSMAEAGFGVCTGTTTVTGTLRAMDGSALISTTSVIANVVAIDLTDHGTVRGALANDGTFSLELGPGSYGVVARRVDDTGAYSAISPSVVEVLGCGEPAPSPLMLTPRAPTPVPAEILAAIRASAGPLPLGGPVATDGLPPPRIRLAATTTIGSLVPAMDTIVQALVTYAGNAAGNQVSFLSDREIGAILDLGGTIQALGEDGASSIDWLSLMGADFVVVLKVEEIPGSRVVTVRLVTAQDVSVRARSRTVAPTDDAVLDAVIAMALELVGRPVDFFALLRAHQPCPMRPTLSVVGPLATLVGGAPLPITLTATLREAGTRLCDMRPVQFRILTPDFALGDVDRMLVPTNAMGVASATFATRGGPGLGRYWAVYEGPPTTRTWEHQYDVAAPAGGATLRTSRAGLFPGETADVDVTLVSGAATPRSGVMVSVDTTLGTLSTGTVTTGAGGTARFTLTAPATGAGLGELRATGPTATMGDVVASIPFVVLGHVDLQATTSSPTVYDSGEAAITGRVLVDGEPVRGLTVGLALAGLGTLQETSAATGQDGIFVAHYSAPPTGAGAGTSTITLRVVVDGVATTTDVSFMYVDVAFSATDGYWIGRITASYACGAPRVFRDASVRIYYEPTVLCDDFVTLCELSVWPSVDSGIRSPETLALDRPFTIARTSARGEVHTWVHDARFRLTGDWTNPTTCGKATPGTNTFTTTLLRRTR